MISASDSMLVTMRRRDPTLDGLLAKSAGWVVFPSIGEGGFIVGAQQGVGVVYAKDRGAIGFAVLRQGSVGAQLGGREFAEVIVLRTPAALQRLRDGNFEITSQAQATVLRSGSADAATTAGDTSVFVDNESGLMASAAFGAQRISFEPLV